MIGTRLLTTTAALALAGVAGAAQAQQIDVWTLNFSSEAANNAVMQIASDFEAANPGTTVKVTLRGIDELKTALRVSAGSSSGPDIFFSWAGLGLGGEYVNAGMSQPLDSYYEQYGWMDTLLPTATAFADDYQGGLHGVPFTFKGEVVYYSKPLFEKAGLSGEPQSYEELVAAARALKEAGIPAFTFGGTVNWHLMRLMDVLLETTCGAETHDALMAMQASWTETPCAEAAFDELASWTTQYTLRPFMGIDEAQSFNLFAAGRAAMMLEGNWLVQQLAEAVDLEDFGIFPFPTGTDRLYGFAEYHYVSAESEHPDLAAAFLDYFNSTEVQQAHLGAFATNSVNAHVSYGDLRPLDAEFNEIFATYGQMFVNGDQAFPAAVTQEYFRVINGVATGDLAPQEAATALQTFVNGLG